MNIAIITASGIGTRMGEKYKNSPKQFIEVEGKPVLFYCIEHYDKHPEIDAIIIVTLKDYIPFVEDKIKEFNLKKIVGVVPGGKTVKKSIKNGYDKAKELKINEDDIILIQDGVRPIVFDTVISNVIQSVKENGPTLPGIPNKTGNYIIAENKEVKERFSKNQIFAGTSPQSMTIKDFEFTYNKAMEKDILDDERFSTCYVSLAHTLGKKIYIVEEEELMNLKITTPAELEIFKAIMRIGKEENRL